MNPNAFLDRKALIVGWKLAFAALVYPTIACAAPTPAESREVCAYIAKRGPAIASELIRSGVLDANNDGIEEDVSIGNLGGTMGGDSPEFRPRGAPPGLDPVSVEQDGFEWKDYSPFGAGWFKHGRHVYVLYFDAEYHRHAEYLGYIDPQNVEHIVCDFVAIEKEDLLPSNAKNKRLCRRVADHRVSYLPVRSASTEESARKLDRRETGITGWANVDPRNIGHPDPLVLLQYASGAGRGCDFNYHDYAENGEPTSQGEVHDLLMKLQRVDLKSFNPGPTCTSNKMLWFAYQGRTYLESGPTPFIQTSLSTR